MPTAYIDTVVTAKLGDVTLFETDCVAEVEYTVDAGELADWHITDFRFDACAYRVSDGAAKRVKTAEVWCPDILRPTLLEYADKDAIEEKLVEQLLADGEMYFTADDQRRDYHARVL